LIDCLINPSDVPQLGPYEPETEAEHEQSHEDPNNYIENDEEFNLDEDEQDHGEVELSPAEKRRRRRLRRQPPLRNIYYAEGDKDDWNSVYQVGGAVGIAVVVLIVVKKVIS